MLINRAIFVESTISHQELQPYIDKHDMLLPSIRRGQLIKLYKNHPNIKEVVIIDGIFDQMPSITHKEILWLISLGVHVTGLGSMGALRAYELRYHGMAGFGWIYNQYIKAKIDGDDEVAISYDPVNPTNNKTLALVNIRKSLDKEDYEYVNIIKRIHFKKRTWNMLKEYIPKKIFEKIYYSYIDIKRIDTINFFCFSYDRVKNKNHFISNIFFKNMLLNYAEENHLDFIKSKIKVMSNTCIKEQGKYFDVCSFLCLPKGDSGKISFILERLDGIRCNPIKIKKFINKLIFEIKFDYKKYMKENNISPENFIILCEKIIKIIDYFLCEP